MSGLYLLPALLLLAAWLLPLHVLPWMSWHNEMLATWALLTTCVIAIASDWRTVLRRGVFIPSLAVVPALWVLVAAVQWALGYLPFGGTVWTAASYGFLAVAAAVLGHRAAQADGGVPSLDLLARVMVVAGVLQWLVAMDQSLGLWPSANWVARTGNATRAGGNFAQPNQAGLLFVFASASAAYLLLRGHLGRLSSAALLLLFASGVAATQSRSALAALVVLLACAVMRRRSLGGHAVVLVAVISGLMALALFRLWPVAIGEYWAQGVEGVNTTTSGRLVMWQQLLAAVQLHPWTGWGVMQVAAGQNAIADRYPEVMAATFGHNVLLDLALWAGVPLALLTAALVIWWMAPRLRDTRSLQGCYSAALAIPMLTQSMTEFPYSYAFFVVPVCFALGSLDALSGRSRGVTLPIAAPAAAVAGAIVLHAGAVVEYANIEEDFRVARFEALRLGGPPAGYAAPRVRLLTQLGALLEATRMRARPNMSDADLQLLRAVALEHPWGATNFRYAVALALNGRPDEARRQLAVYRATQGEKSYLGMLGVIDEMARDEPVLRQLHLPQ